MHACIFILFHISFQFEHSPPPWISSGAVGGMAILWMGFLLTSQLYLSRQKTPFIRSGSICKQNAKFFTSAKLTDIIVNSSFLYKYQFMDACGIEQSLFYTWP